MIGPHICIIDNIRPVWRKKYLLSNDSSSFIEIYKTLSGISILLYNNYQCMQKTAMPSKLCFMKQNISKTNSKLFKFIINANIGIKRGKSYQKLKMFSVERDK